MSRDGRLGPPEPRTLTRTQAAAVDRAEALDLSLTDLVSSFSDPRDAFVFSPAPLSFKQLAQLYLHTVPEDQAATFPATLRRRARDERWSEERAITQARRIQERRESYLVQEATVWATLGTEFRTKQLRSLFERHEMLDEYVKAGLERCESGDGVFTAALRDASAELARIEDRIMTFVPDAGLFNKAQELWSTKGEGSAQLIARIRERMRIAVGQSAAANVFDAVDAATARGSGEVIEFPIGGGDE